MIVECFNSTNTDGFAKKRRFESLRLFQYFMKKPNRSLEYSLYFRDEGTLICFTKMEEFVFILAFRRFTSNYLISPPNLVFEFETCKF